MAKKDQFLELTIMTPRQVVFSGSVQAISSINSGGKFDILPEHANFITIVQNQTITIHLLDQEKKYYFDQAIIYQNANKVNIFAEPKLAKV